MTLTVMVRYSKLGIIVVWIRFFGARITLARMFIKEQRIFKVFKFQL